MSIILEETGLELSAGNRFELDLESEDDPQPELESNEAETFVLDSPVDMHLHLRQGDMLDLVAPFTAKSFAGALIMPNIMDEDGKPALVNLYAVLEYHEEIIGSLRNHGIDVFEPYMTLFMIQEGYDFTTLQQMKDFGIVGVKYYPCGATTNSHNGVHDWRDPLIISTLKSMADLGIPLLVHPETDGFVLDREREFLSIIKFWIKEVPDLSIVLEHITTSDACQFVQDHGPNVTATITAHHLVMTLDDVVGGLMSPHNFCKPIAKLEEDRDALRKAAFSGSELFCLGTDSAPHPRHKKECCGCAAGCFTAPIALQLLTGEFLSGSTKENLKKFVCYNARIIYGVNPPKKQVILQKKDFEVPLRYTNGRMDGGRIEVVPFKAGEVLEWSLKR